MLNLHSSLVHLGQISGSNGCQSGGGKIKQLTWLLFKCPAVAGNDFWSPREKVLRGTELSDAKGQIPQGEISA